VIFNSFTFAIYFTIIFLLYWFLPHKYRWLLLLAASYYFYISWGLKLVIWLFITTGISYVCARAIEKNKDDRIKKRYMLAALIACLSILFVFKYFNFISSSLTDLLRLFSLPISEFTLDIMLPVGISFYTFKTISYVVDVYRGTIKAENHFGIYALYVSFFPQIIAGPIDRAQNLLKQFHKERQFYYFQAAYGLKLVAWGFFKKLAVADNLASYVNKVFDNVYEYSGFSLIVAAVFFSIQIYCDFSGYTDIANGVAKMLGINAVKNFDSPYFSTSMQEFWRRWHISLSTWFRDYVYIPLGGNRVKIPRYYMNLMITFMLSGLWHGANWTFIIWGGLHGLYLVVAKMTGTWKKKLYGVLRLSEENFIVYWLKVAVTFSLVCFAWIFFRANTIGDAFYVISHMFDGIGFIKVYAKVWYVSLSINKPIFLMLFILIFTVVAVDYVQLKRDMIELLSKKPMVLRWTIYVVFMLYVILLSYKGVPADFIYAQF
jgi:alginate O-acetyltransferase complex protein AlgI